MLSPTCCLFLNLFYKSTIATDLSANSQVCGYCRHVKFAVYYHKLLNSMSEKFEASKTSGVHFQLSRLAGEWEGVSRTWFDPGTVADESPVRGSMRLILDGRFILHEYKGTMQGKPLDGMAIYGYHLGLGKFQAAWVDSFHNGTALMFSEGKRGDTALSMLGSYAYVTHDREQHWGWRTEIEIVNDLEIKITAYNISPEGEEAKATEVVYKKLV
jgi:hypothetical protein